MVDRVYREVSKTFEEEERAARSENRPRKMVKLGEIPSITDPEYLCQLLDEDNDPEGIQVYTMFHVSITFTTNFAFFLAFARAS